jgi:hypothetical protein
MAKQAGYGGVNILYMVRNLPWIEPKSVEDDQDAL